MLLILHPAGSWEWRVLDTFTITMHQAPDQYLGYVYLTVWSGTWDGCGNGSSHPIKIYSPPFEYNLRSVDRIGAFYHSSQFEYNFS